MQATRHRSVGKRYPSLSSQCAGKDPVTAGRPQRCPARLVRADRLDALGGPLGRERLQKPQAILHAYALGQHGQQGQQGQCQAP
jgi:hypothetical protein